MRAATSDALLVVILTTLFLLPVSFCAGAVDEAEKKANYWNDQAQGILKTRLNTKLNLNVAKNVIIFIGDGMGITTVTAARIYKGQKENKPGEEGNLVFDTFPHVGLIKTYNVDRQVPDSAATATAIFSGVKTKYELLGVTAATVKGDCSTVAGNEVTTILQWAQDEGKDTGIVTTTRVTHATPAALYAKSAHRNWESDVDKPANASSCLDIARQLIQIAPGNKTKVILGGGRGKFLSEPEGSRKDGLNLTREWVSAKKNARYVTNNKQLQQLDFSSTDYLLGLFGVKDVPYEVERNTGPEGEPSLADMTKAALKILQKGKNGFFLMVEGGRIDHGHHRNLAKKALEETLAMDQAIRDTLDSVDLNDTLVVVTADHSHVMTFNGYPERGNPILGIADISDMDHLPFTTLMYTNGPGYVNDTVAARRILNQTNLDDKEYEQLSLLPNSDETHGGEDVGIYATGPMGHLFHGVQEQNYIAHAMGYAACIGPNQEHCRGAASLQNISPAAIFLLLVCCLLNRICED